MQRRSSEAILSPAVRVERRRTVWADDLQVLEAVVVGDAVYVVENQRHLLATPQFTLTTELAFADLQSLLEQARL